MCIPHVDLNSWVQCLCPVTISEQQSPTVVTAGQWHLYTPWMLMLKQRSHQGMQCPFRTFAALHPFVCFANVHSSAVCSTACRGGNNQVAEVGSVRFRTSGAVPLFCK